MPLVEIEIWIFLIVISQQMNFSRGITIAFSYGVMCVSTLTVGILAAGQIVGEPVHTVADSMIGNYCRGIDTLCKSGERVAKEVSELF